MKQPCIRKSRVRPGDIALSNRGLDGREVSRIEQNAEGVWMVWIWIGAQVSGPYPADNYTFTRREYN